MGVCDRHKTVELSTKPARLFRYILRATAISATPLHSHALPLRCGAAAFCAPHVVLCYRYFCYFAERDQILAPAPCYVPLRPRSNILRELNKLDCPQSACHI